MEKDKHLTYSKMLPIITGLLFTISLFVALFVPKNETAISVIITCVSVSGGIFAGTILMYMRKAMRENVYKLDVASLKEKEKIELDHKEKILCLERKYNIDEAKIEQINYESSLDNAVEEGYMDMRNNISQAKEETKEASEMEFSPKS